MGAGKVGISDRIDIRPVALLHPERISVDLYERIWMWAA